MLNFADFIISLFAGLRVGGQFGGVGLSGGQVGNILLSQLVQDLLGGDILFDVFAAAGTLYILGREPVIMGVLHPLALNHRTLAFADFMPVFVAGSNHLAVADIFANMRVI